MFSNRVVVMARALLGLQRGRYNTLSPTEQTKVATDLVKAVCQYWGGRILVDQGVHYQKLSHDQAVAAMKNLLSPQSAKAVKNVPASVPSKPLLSAPPVPEFLRNASADLLSNGSGQPQNMQSAAVKSLQQRKAKRQIAKNLGRGITVPEGIVPDSFQK